MIESQEMRSWTAAGTQHDWPTSGQGEGLTRGSRKIGDFLYVFLVVSIFLFNCHALSPVVMAAQDAPDQPSLLWRTGSSFITGATGFLCRTFLIGLNRLELNGYDKFLKLLDERADVNGRTKGLITGN